VGTERPYTELVGGPLDGVVCARRSEPFAYYQSYGSGVRCHQLPGTGRWLYRLAADGKYHYAHYHFRRCANCGATIASRVCQICLQNS
jgi:hypothetical protein